MPEPTIRDIDDYEAYLQGALAELSPAQRIAFCAAMAERYLPVYVAFSKAEDWGDPAQLRRSLDAVWEHLAAQTLRSSDLERHLLLVRDSTPHMDDFDAEEALAAAVLVGEALESCRSTENTGPAVQAAISGFEAALPGWSEDARDQPRLWQKNAVRREFSQQVWLLERVRSAQKFDAAAIQALRRAAASPEHAGKIPKPKTPAGPPRLTNQALFEQYRRMVESDIRSAAKGWGQMAMTPELEAMRLLSQWMGRYRRRMQTIDGSYGAWADTAAQHALVLRNKAIDAAAPGLPDWQTDFRRMIEMAYANPYSTLGAQSLDEPHGYGPSLRRLWVEAKNRGLSDAAAFEQVAAWGRHRPAAWENEDRRKKKGRAHAAPVLVEALSRPLAWELSPDPLLPWLARVETQNWQVRLNDFPDDYMYTLLVDGEEQGSFHDWPETWKRTQVVEKET